MKKERIAYLDTLKVLATFSVIIMHLCTNLNTTFINWSIYKSLNIICNFAVPIFVMVSGALLLDTKRNITIKDIFCKYIPRLILSLIVVNLLTTIIFGIINKNLSIKLVISGVYNVFLNNVPVPYWYIYMIIGLYIVTPILKDWINNLSIKKIEYFLIIFVLYRVVGYTILNIPNIDFLDKFYNIYNSFQLPLITGYCGYYILGYYLHNKDFSKLKNSKLITTILLSLVITILLELLYGAHSDNFVTSSTVFKDVFSINIFTISVCLFILCKNNIKKEHKLITKVSLRSYGIYLFHVLGLKLVVYLNILNDNAIIYVLISTVIIFIFSYSMTYIFQKIPVIGKNFN